MKSQANVEATAPDSGRSTRDILIAARALIEKPERWIKGKFFDTRWVKGKPAQDCYCAVGAISQAGFYLARTALNEDAISAVSVGAGLPAKTYWKPLSNWNDAPERTHAEVLAAFDRAIAASCPTDGPIASGRTT